jgi:multidrug efflux pump subunit AcrA (membrane-fusion protein)
MEISKEVPVEVKELAMEEYETTISYVGVIKSDDLIKYSFKTGGIIDQFTVDVGDEVHKGDILVKLDKSDLATALSVSKSQMEAAEAQYNKAKTGGSPEEQKVAELNLKKAKDAYAYALENLEKSEKLYEAGALSESKIKQIRLETEMLKSDLEQAQEMYNQATQGARQEDLSSALANYNQAKTNYQHNLKSYNDSELKSTIDGFVASKQFEKGELVGAGYPVIIVRSDNQIVSIGISQKDIQNVEVGMEAIVKVFDKKLVGKLVSISEIPNESTNLYNAKVAIEDTNYKLGIIADVDIIIGKSEGVWIPLDTIKYSGSNYVFIAQDGKVIRKNISILDQHNGLVRVSGLKPGDLLITTNSNIIKPGDLIEISERQE